MCYSEAIRYLYGLQRFGSVLGLDVVRELAARAGDPHRRLRFIHVAGTNGKGSTCAMLESIYRAAGLRVGLFTSPHLVSFRERIQINRQLISETEVARRVEEARALAAAAPLPREPTLFELVTVMALGHFADQGCDLVIWETGLGGRLDATNIVTPLASVITNVQLDHQQWLGNTTRRIAHEKAGIIKPGIPVLTAVDDSDALQVVTAMAAEKAAPLSHIRSSDLGRLVPRGISLPLAGDHQRLNAGLAAATVGVLQPQIPVPAAAIHEGLTTVHWSGRLELLPLPGGRRALLDGAHNPAGIRTLLAALPQVLEPPPWGLIFGAMDDKHWEEMCALLAPHFHQALVVPVPGGRGADPAAIATALHKARPGLPVKECASLREALTQAGTDCQWVVTGSLQLIGEALEELATDRNPPAGERSLNNWTGTHSDPLPPRDREKPF